MERGARPLAAVYRGPVACDGCPESVYRLLQSSPANFQVSYIGPKESQDVTAASLKGLSLFAFPGGGDDVDTDYKKVSNYTTALQDYVRNGGLYAGFCFGAYLARGSGSKSSFFGLLPDGSYVDSEVGVSGGQIKTSADTVAQVDWTFRTGDKQGQTEASRWMYFQDSGRLVLDSKTQANSTILGRYSYTKNICAAIIPYGSGRVGLVGFHPEAETDWYTDAKISNPEGVKFDIGYDFVQSLYTAKSGLNMTNPNDTVSGTPGRSAGGRRVVLGNEWFISTFLLLVWAFGMM